MLARALTPSWPGCLDALPWVVAWLEAKGMFVAMQRMPLWLHAVSGGWASQVEVTISGDDHACRRYALQAIDAQAQVDALRERLREVVGVQQGAWVQHQRWARLCEQPYTMLHKQTVLWETYFWSQSSN